MLTSLARSMLTCCEGQPSAECISESEGEILLQMKPQRDGGWESREDPSRTPPPNPQPSAPTYVLIYTLLLLCSQHPHKACSGQVLEGWAGVLR